MKEPYIGMPITFGMPCNNMQDSAPLPEAPVSPTTDVDAVYLASLPIAMAYTPMQKWKTTYSAENALARGTLFPELDLPFEGRTVLTSSGKRGML